ncbi:MAG: solute carrier family 23 protein [Evtepia gabavorous]
MAALLAGMVDFTGLSGSTLLGGENPILGLQPFFTDFSGSVAKFDLSAILVMAPIAVASMMEHIGDISAISATVGENFIEKPGLHRTLVGDGVATALAGLFGGRPTPPTGRTPACWPFPGSTIPGDPAGSPVCHGAVLSPAFAYLVNTIPAAIIGGVSFILYGMISAIGVRNVVENRVDFTNSRNLIIAAVILVCGLGFTDGLTFHVGA